MKNKAALAKEMDRMLEEGISNTFSTEYYQRFLSFVARNPNYSYRNVIFILQQCPKATQTKGMCTWNKEGRMIKPGETGLRINACFDRDEDKEEPPGPPSKKKRGHKGGSTFRRVSVFDISQTKPKDGEDNQQPQREAPAGNVLEIAPPQGAAAGVDELLRDLRELSPPSINFGFDKGNPYAAQTIIAQISLVWLGTRCPGREQLKMAARSVTYIVCRHLGLDTSALGFGKISEYSQNQEQSALEKLLDTVQKTALYFIDSIDGIREARKTGYPTDEFFLFTNKKTALRMFRQGYYIYLVYPGQGELLAMNKDALMEYDGPFAVHREDWVGVRDGSLAA